MKYCCRYQKYNSKFMNTVDEILIRYNPSDITFIDFLKKYNDKRIIIAIDNKILTRDEILKLSEIYKINSNFVIKINEYDLELINIIKENNLPFFINIFANNLDTFIGLVNTGVSDIYVTDSLCFNLKKCSDIAKNNNIYLRTFPNVAQSQWKDMDGVKKFFIRPDDIDIYEKYIDIVEFICDISQEEALYKIYTEKRWFGPLKEIIVGLNSDINGQSILPLFGEIRTECKKECLIGGKCNICNEIEELSKIFREKNIYINKEKGE